MRPRSVCRTSQQAQTATQTANVTQTSASGSGNVTLTQDAAQCVATFTTGATSQNQVTDQEFTIQQVPAVFNGNASDCVAQSGGAQASASQAQHQYGFAILAGSGTQKQHADLVGHLDQCTTGVASYTAKQTEDQFLGKNSRLTQIQEGPTSLKGGKLKPKQGRTLQRGHCCSFQGTTTADTCKITQSTSQRANANALQTEDLLAQAGSTGTCQGNISSTQNQTTNTASATSQPNQPLSVTLQCQSGSCGPIPTAVAWAGPTTGVYHDGATLSATLTRTDTNQPLAGQTLQLAAGGETCSAGPTNSSGSASCSVTLNHSPGAGPFTAQGSFGGSSQYDVSSSTPVAFTVTPQPTTLAYTGATTGRYHDSVQLKALLKEAHTGNVVDDGTSPVTISLTGSPDCTSLATAAGIAVCAVTLGQQPGGAYSAAASFAGNVNYGSSTAGATAFTVTKRGTIVTYDGPSHAEYHHGVTLHATLTEDDPGRAPIADKTVTLTLGSAPSCTGTTNASGGASCTVAKITQAPGAVSVSASFPEDAYYLSSGDTKSFTIDKSHVKVVYSGSATTEYSDPATFKATLYEDDGTTPIGGVSIAFSVGADTCSATTSASGFASCTTRVFQPSGPNTVVATSAETAFFLSGSDSKPFTLTKEESELKYAGPTSGKKNTSVTVSAKLTFDMGPISGRAVTFTLDSASCTGTTSSSGIASCLLPTGSSTGFQTLKSTFAGDAYFRSDSTSISFKVTS